MKNENKARKNESKLDNVLERGKKFLEFMTSNIYDTTNIKVNINPRDGDLNPFSTVKKVEDDRLDTLDRIELLEYSQDLKLSVRDRNKERDRDTISESADSHALNNTNHEMNIKDYENFILKIEDLVLLDDKTLSQFNQNLMYIECKVPLFKIETDGVNPAQTPLFYDTFKIFNKGPAERNNNIFHLSHVSYHKLKLGEDNFGVLANSKIEIYLHKLDTKRENLDVIIGKGEIEFNKIFLSTDFFYTANLDIVNYIAEGLTQEDKNVKETKQKRGTSNAKMAPKKKGAKSAQDQIDFPFKIGELQISCQLFKSNLDREKDIKDNIRRGYKGQDLSAEEAYEEINYNGNNMQNSANVNEHFENQQINYEEIKLDYEGILVLYLNVANLKPIENLDNPKVDLNVYRKNYFISHKIFPNAEVSSSEVVWNSIRPNFKYQVMMPFTLNARTIEMLDTGSLMLEVWHKGNYDDELLGTVRLELNSILESLKIGEDTLSISPISKNLMPLIIYDGFHPVFNYEEFINVFYLNLTLGLGTATQVNNYIKKQSQIAGLVSIESNSNDNMIYSTNNNNNFRIQQNSEKDLRDTVKKPSHRSYENTITQNMDTDEVNANAIVNADANKQIQEKRNIIDDEMNDINNLLNDGGNNMNNMHVYQMPGVNNNVNHMHKQAEDIDVEEILERNKKELDNVNNKYKYSMSSMGETKKYEASQVNPFLLPKEDPQAKNNSSKSNNVENAQNAGSNFNFFKQEQKFPNFQVSKESNFYINEKEREIEKLTENEFFNSRRMNNLDSKNLNQVDDFVIESSPKKIKVEENKPKVEDSIKNSQAIKHTFDITIDKLINLQVLSKITGKAYIKYSFLSDSSNDWVKSDNLAYTSYAKESSIVDVDMKTTHSILLSSSEKIKDYLHDFSINFIYLSQENEEAIFGKVNLPSEEFANLISSEGELNSTLFIYGTEKIKRQDCIIGKMKLQIKYEKAFSTDADTSASDNILMERQTTFNRKIPKNATISFKINYFKYDDNFLDYFDVNTGVFYLEVDPFAENKQLKRKFSKQRTSKKYNSLNGIFEEEFNYDMVIESDILDYIKNKYAIINLVTYNKPHNFINSSGDFADISSDSDNDNFQSPIKELIGIAKIKISDIISYTDYVNKNLNITAKTNPSLSLGFVNIDVKIESSTVPNNSNNNSRSKTNTNFKGTKAASTTKMRLDNLKEIMKAKNDRSLDGKYYFVINFQQLMFDENFQKKLTTVIKGQNNTTNNTTHMAHNTYEQFYLMYKFGKNIKKMTKIYELNKNKQEYVEIFSNPMLAVYNLNHIDILELTLSFSKNKPEDLIKQLMENVFEVKFYIKSAEDNIHIGSFMIDLSKLFLSECKINSNIYYSDLCNVYYFDLNSKHQEAGKLSSTFTLIKSDLNTEDFNNFYMNTYHTISNYNNFPILRDCALTSSSDVKKILTNLLKSNNAEMNYYEYIDLYLFNIEDDNGDIISQNIANLLKVFSGGVGITSILIEHVEALSAIFQNKKLNLKKTVGLASSKYTIGKMRIRDLFTGKDFNNLNISIDDLLECYYKDREENITCKVNFALYSGGSMNADETTDLYDMLIYFFKFVNFDKNFEAEDNNYMEDERRFTENTSTVSIIIYSATNIALEYKPINQRPNCYFLMNWEDDNYSSEVVVKTSHPSWNQMLEIKIPIRTAREKLTSPVIFQFYSKENIEEEGNIRHFNSSVYNLGLNNISGENFNSTDEFIGKVKINLLDILGLNLLNEKNQHEDFHPIINNGRVRGQVNIKFQFEDKLLQSLEETNLNWKSNSTFKSEANPYLNLQSRYNGSFNKISSDYHSKSRVTNMKKYQFNEDADIDTETLWDKLNRNTEMIKKLTQEIDLQEGGENNKYDRDVKKEEFITAVNKSKVSTIERERRMTENKQEDINSNLLNMDMDMIDMELFEMDLDNLEQNIRTPAEMKGLEEIDNCEDKIEDHNVEIGKENNDNSVVIAGNANNMSMKSINTENDIIDKAYSDIQCDLNFNKKESGQKVNQSVIENLKVNNSKITSKKPPIPALNKLYQNADKNFLNRIQNILKKKDSKKLNYASSEESS